MAWLIRSFDPEKDWKKKNLPSLAINLFSQVHYPHKETIHFSLYCQGASSIVRNAWKRLPAKFPPTVKKDRRSSLVSRLLIQSPFSMAVHMVWHTWSTYPYYENETNRLIRVYFVGGGAVFIVQLFWPKDGINIIKRRSGNELTQETWNKVLAIRHSFFFLFCLPTEKEWTDWLQGYLIVENRRKIF